MARGGKELIRGLCSYGQWGWPRVRSPLNLHIGIILLGCAHCPRLVPLSQSCEASKAPRSRGWVPGRVCLQSMGTAGLCSGGVASGPSTWGGVPMSSLSFSLLLSWKLSKVHKGLASSPPLPCLPHLESPHSFSFHGVLSYQIILSCQDWLH